jgi:hypothetical protein
LCQYYWIVLMGKDESFVWRMEWEIIALYIFVDSDHGHNYDSYPMPGDDREVLRGTDPLQIIDI